VANAGLTGTTEGIHALMSAIPMQNRETIDPAPRRYTAKTSKTAKNLGIPYAAIEASPVSQTTCRPFSPPSGLDFQRIRDQSVDNTTLAASQGILNWRFDSSGKALLVGNNPAVHPDDEDGEKAEGMRQP
jgi:hypothetical protein